MVTREAPMGEVCMLPPGLKCCLGQRMVLLRPDTSKIDGRFLLYAIQSPQVQRLILHHEGTGSTVSNMRIPALEQLPIPSPPLAEQQRVGALLGALDDKIELNRRMSRTLEEIAQTIFKSWFVDFDGHDDLIDSAVGPIPRGWEVGPAAGMIVLLSGGTPSTSTAEYWDGTIPWFSVKDAPPDGEVWVVDTEKKVTEAGVQNSATQVLPEGTTIISARGTVGKLALTGVPMAMNQSCYGVRGDGGYPEYYTYYLLKFLVDELQRRTHGSVFDTITRRTFETVPVVRSPVGRAQKFQAVVSPLLKKILANKRQSLVLTELRDTLLPRLISGEVRVGADHELGGEES